MLHHNANVATVCLFKVISKIFLNASTTDREVTVHLDGDHHGLTMDLTEEHGRRAAEREKLRDADPKSLAQNMGEAPR